MCWQQFSAMVKGLSKVALLLWKFLQLVAMMASQPSQVFVPGAQLNPTGRMTPPPIFVKQPTSQRTEACQGNFSQKSSLQESLLPSSSLKYSQAKPWSCIESILFGVRCFLVSNDTLMILRGLPGLQLPEDAPESCQTLSLK